MYLLQNGLNTVTGDPTLDKERLVQIDAGIRYLGTDLRLGLSGYHAWIRDYIAFRKPERVPLCKVGRRRASPTQVHKHGPRDAHGGRVPRGNRRRVPRHLLRHVPVRRWARDRTRDGRGVVPGSSQEPLPRILPWESRLGVRVHAPKSQPTWSVELSAHVVDRQDRVATSLLELETPGYTVWDLRGYWQPWYGVLLIGGVENFTDRNYRDHLDFRPRPGSINNPIAQTGINFYFGSEISY